MSKGNVVIVLMIMIVICCEVALGVAQVILLGRDHPVPPILIAGQDILSHTFIPAFYCYEYP